MNDSQLYTTFSSLFDSQMPDRSLFNFINDEKEKTNVLKLHDLKKYAKNLAYYLKIKLKLKKGDKVVLVFVDTESFIKTLSACFLAGIIPVPCTPFFGSSAERKIEAIASNSDSEYILMDKTYSNYRLKNLVKKPKKIAKKIFSRSKSHKYVTIQNTYNNPPLEKIEIPDSENQLCYIQYTSGSTSAPKGICISWKNLIHQLKLSGDILGANKNSRTVIWVPHFHDFGFLNIMHCFANHGEWWIISPQDFIRKPKLWMQTLSDVKATHTVSPNFGYSLIVNKTTPSERAKWDLSHLKSFMNAAEPILPNVMDDFFEAFKVTGLDESGFCPSYGLAEHTVGVSLNGSKRVIIDRKELANQIVKLADNTELGVNLISCGDVNLTDIQIEIVNVDTHKKCLSDEIGEIWVNSDSKALGYYKEQELTQQVFQAKIIDYPKNVEFLRTGDLGFIHEGEIYITGRLKEMILIKGKNHYPNDIENTIYQVSDMIRKGGCIAYGSTNYNSEENLEVVCEVKDVHLFQLKRDELINTIQISLLEHHGIVPSKIYFLRKKSIPKTSSGKPQRLKCKQQIVTKALEKAIIHVVNTNHQPNVNIVNQNDEPDLLVIDKLVAIITKEINIPKEKININVEIGNYIQDSIRLIELLELVNQTFNITVQPQEVYLYPTIKKLSQFIESKISEDPTKPVDRKSPQKNNKITQGHIDVAVIGMAGKFPGSINIEEYWDNIENNRDLITEPSSHRRKILELEDDETNEFETAGYIEGIDMFDAAYFGISAYEASRMDPQHRLVLEHFIHALEDAGISTSSICDSDMGVFMGVSSIDYLLKINDSSSEVSAFDSIGLAHSMLVNRISYLYNLHGPSEPVDTACSSSLVAIHKAVEYIKKNKNSIAVAGGVNLLMSKELTKSFAKAGMLSPDGKCKTFDDSANGYVRGEGIGMLVLKSLEQAEFDGDRILAVIRNTKINHGGKANTITSPNPKAQNELICDVYNEIDIQPEDISYIEAHGTGTSLGDPIEIEALKLAFNNLSKSPSHLKNYCGVGSVKANIGHLEAAAGVAGIIKAIMALNQKTIPGNPHLKKQNKYIDVAESPFFLCKETKEWKGDKKRIAGISSFGFGGVNAHIVLAEYNQNRKPTKPDFNTYIIPLSANSSFSLKQSAKNILNFLVKGNHIDLADLAYTLQIGRAILTKQIVFIANNLSELVKLLENFISEGEISNKVYKINQTNATLSYESLCKQWLSNGDEFCWKSALYPEGNYPNKIALPLYPFEKKSYWIDNGNNNIIDDVDYKTASYLPVWKKIEWSALNQIHSEKIASCQLITTNVNGSFNHQLNKYLSTKFSTLNRSNSVIDSAHSFEHIYWVIDTTSFDESTKQNWLEQKVLKEVKYLIENVNLNESIHITVFTFSTQKVIPNDTVLPSNGASLHGFFGSLAREKVNWKIKVWDVPNRVDDYSDLFNKIDKSAAIKTTSLAFRNDNCFQQKLISINLPSVTTQTVKQEGSYIMLGGAGGLGQVTTQYLREQYSANIIWLGRKPLSATLEEKLNTLNKGKGSIRYFQCDANNENNVKEVCDLIKNEFPKINGLFHMGIVLNDKLISEMSVEDFETSFDVKSIGFKNFTTIFSAAFELDFAAIFSSLQSYLPGPSQANYAAGCTLIDSYAHYINDELGVTAKVINWGYWGSVGVVAQPKYISRMKKLGIFPINEAVAMKQLDAFLNSSCQQIVIAAFDRSKLKLLHNLFDSNSKCQFSNNIFTHQKPTLQTVEFTTIQPLHKELEALVRHSILSKWITQDIIYNGISISKLMDNLQVLERYKPLVNELLNNLVQSGIIDISKQKLEFNDTNFKPIDNTAIDREFQLLLDKYENESSQILLLQDAVNTHLRVIRGSENPIKVLFKEGDIDKAQDIYGKGKQSVFFNNTVANYIKSIVVNTFQSSPAQPIKILEIGAGTGATCVSILDKLGSYADNIEYHFSDISIQFLTYANANIKTQYSNVKTLLFDIDNSAQNQKIELDSYDIVVASNAIHIAKDIAFALQNIKQVLKKNGLLVLNELVKKDILLTSSFGLLKDWWAFQDGDQRISASPLLNSVQWQNRLKEAGFSNTLCLVKHSELLPQQVFVAKSNGLSIVNDNVRKKIEVVAKPKEQVISSSNSLENLIKIIADVQELTVEEIDRHSTLEELGIDSLTATVLAEEVSKIYDNISVDLFFEPISIVEIALKIDTLNENAIIVNQPNEEEVEKSAAHVKDLAYNKGEHKKEKSTISILGRFGTFAGEEIDNCLSESDSYRTFSKQSAHIQDDFEYLSTFKLNTDYLSRQFKHMHNAIAGAIYDAGLTPKDMSKKKVGIFLALNQLPIQAGQSNHAQDTLVHLLPTKVAHLLNVMGPNEVINSSCTSAFNAINRASDSINQGYCDIAIVGGVNILDDSSSEFYENCEDISKLLSPSQTMSSFSDNADGFCRREGAAALIISKNDFPDFQHIIPKGKILGSSFIHGGRNLSWEAPSAKGIKECIKMAISKAELSPDQIDYVELHGIANKMADTIEVAAVSEAYSKLSSLAEKKWKAGCVKPLFGHTELVSGFLSLFRVLESFNNNIIPGIPGLNAINSDLPSTNRLILNANNIDWETTNNKKIAALSSYAIGGVCAHLIIEACNQ